VCFRSPASQPLQFVIHLFLDFHVVSCDFPLKFYIRFLFHHLDETRNVHKIVFRKPEGYRPLGRPKRRWKDNMRMDLTDTAREGVD
jgi:hypothetical protein